MIPDYKDKVLPQPPQNKDQPVYTPQPVPFKGKEEAFKSIITDDKYKLPDKIKAVDPYQKKEDDRQDEKPKIVYPPDSPPPKTIYAPDAIPTKPVEQKKEIVKPYDPQTKVLIPI